MIASPTRNSIGTNRGFEGWHLRRQDDSERPDRNVFFDRRGQLQACNGIDRDVAFDPIEVRDDLLQSLRVAGLVERVREPETNEDVPGYQVPASGIRWVAGPGTAIVHDPIRVPHPPAEGARPNKFFLDFYRNVAADGQGLEAREHTAQVPYAAREEREERFRSAKLPVLFCSPTMELGVDIASLNVVIC